MMDTQVCGNDRSVKVAVICFYWEILVIQTCLTLNNYLNLSECLSSGTFAKLEKIIMNTNELFLNYD